MKTALVLLLSIPLAVLAYGTAEQTDWSGGDGVPGPVTNWEDTFESATDVNWSGIPGRFVLSGEALDTPVEHLVDDDINFPNSVYAADLDGDGDQDVLCAAYNDNEIAWWENLDGSGMNWYFHFVAVNFNGAQSVYAADIDGDDDLDILGAAGLDGDVVCWLNADGDGGSWTRVLIDYNFLGAISVYAADVDGDDDTDVIGAAWRGDEIAWWSNDDGAGTDWTKHTVESDYDGATCVYAADVDGDDDIDILGTSSSFNEIAWWENTDGSGTSWIKHVLSGGFGSANSVCATDMNGDGDIDIIGSAYSLNSIFWWENRDGSGSSWTDHMVDNNFEGTCWVSAADVDGDNDKDILGAACVGDDITWWENMDGEGTSWTEHLVFGYFDGAVSVYAADLDGDKGLDVLGACAYADTIAWWEVTEFRDSGELASSILDTGGGVGWGVVDWVDDEPADTTLTVEARASDNAGAMGDWVEIAEDDLSDYLPDGLRYLQYRVGLESATGEATPTFNWVRFSWSDDPAVDDVELSASAAEDGILIGWTIRGDVPARLRILREVNGGISPLHTDALPGSARRYLDHGVEPGFEYRYWLEVVEADGSVSRFGPTEAVHIESEGIALSLSESYPSPALDTVSIALNLPEDGRVELTVYDLAGRRMATLVDSELTAGRHEVSWNCAEIPSGVYLYRLETSAGSLTNRLVIGR
ncbi:MAG: FG-GAP-like repeat-containing protein [bacterium]|nr:FG-GAP-like repeat-containing protein [bacterium]